MQNMWLKNQIRNRNDEYSEYKSRGSIFSKQNIHVIDDISENNESPYQEKKDQKQMSFQKLSQRSNT